MKNLKKVTVFVFLVMALLTITAFAGCVTTSTEKIEGTLTNTIEDEKCWVKVHYKTSGAMVDQEPVKYNSTEIWELPRGSFTVKAYDSHDYFIASTDLVIGATDTTFTIIVYSDDVHATAS